jgi:tetratricopeptide (TPR) repeat protein
MSTKAEELNEICSGEISAHEGLRDFFEKLVSSEVVKCCILSVESGSFQGRLAFFSSRYLVGAEVQSEPTAVGFEAARQVLSLREGTFRLVEAGSDDIAQWRASLAIDVFSLIDWSAPEFNNHPPPLEAALEGVVEQFAHTMTRVSAHSPPVEEAPLSVIEPDYSPDRAYDPAMLDAIGRPNFPAIREDQPWNLQDLESIPTPHPHDAQAPAGEEAQALSEEELAWRRADEEFRFRRREKPMSEAEKHQLGEVYREKHRSRSAREFLKVAKDPNSESATKIEHKNFSPPLNPKRMAIIAAACSLVLSGMIGLRFLLQGWHDEQVMKQGIARLKSGDNIAALLDFDAVLRNNQQSVEAHLNRATAYMALGQFDNATADYETVRNLEPDNLQANLGAARTAVLRYDYETAFRLLNKCLKLQPNLPEAFALRAIAYCETSQHDLALQDAEKATQLMADPGADLYRAKADSEWKLKKYAEAIADYDRCINAGTSDATAFFGRGYCYLAQGKPDLALADLHQAVKMDPKFAPAYVARATAHATKTNFDKAIEDLEKAIQILPRSAEAYAVRGRVYADMNQDGKAIADFDQALALEPDRPGVAEMRAAAYARVRRMKPLVIGDRPEVAPVIDSKPAAIAPASAKTAAKQPDALTSVLTDALRSSPNDTKSRRYLAYAFIHNGNYKAAIQQFETLAPLGMSVRDRLAYADALVRAGNVDKAVTVYRQELNNNPFDQVARSNLIKLYEQQGRFFDAAKLRGSARAGMRN